MSIVVIAVDHCSDGDANVFPSYGAGPQYDPAGCLLPTCARLWRHSLLADDPGEHPDASLGVPKRQRERIGRTAQIDGLLRARITTSAITRASTI